MYIAGFESTSLAVQGKFPCVEENLVKEYGICLGLYDIKYTFVTEGLLIFVRTVTLEHAWNDDKQHFQLTWLTDQVSFFSD